MNHDYIYFRVRMDIAAVAADTYRDTVGILIDQSGVGTPGKPDFAFMWDSKGEETKAGEHGLEMTQLDTGGAAWNQTKFDDVDGNSAKKIAPPDFATSGGDGYVRLVDGQSTLNFGDTTFIDYAISWNYLLTKSGTGLSTNQTWSLQVGSIANATDHNNITTISGVPSHRPAQSQPVGANRSTPIHPGRNRFQNRTPWPWRAWRFVYSMPPVWCG